MTLEQLRIFLAVAEQLHFTRAADTLYISQPAVSAAIQSMEEEYRIKLFHRIGRHIEITEAGKMLQLEAQKILDLVTLTERGLRELNDLQRGELKLGSSLTIGNYWLPQKISQFQNLYPGIAVKCTLANTEEICEGTASGIFDIGLIEGEVKHSLQNVVEQEEIDRDRLLIVVGRSHPWFERQHINLSELVTIPWVMREPGSGTQQVFERALKNWGINPSQIKVMLVLSSGEMVKAVIESGVGAAAISELMLTKEIQLGTLRSIQILNPLLNSQYIDSHCPTLEITRPFIKLKHKQRFQARTAKVFEEAIVTPQNPLSD